MVHVISKIATSYFGRGEREMSSDTNEKIKKYPASRESYFDALKILAILLVVFNHLPGY